MAGDKKRKPQHAAQSPTEKMHALLRISLTKDEIAQVGGWWWRGEQSRRVVCVWVVPV
jgi:hypothetical protein